MNALINGSEEEAKVPTSRSNYAMQVELGMVRFQELCADNDRLQKENDRLILDLERLDIRVEQAAERERIHVQAVIDEALTEQHRLNAANLLLQDEITTLRRQQSETQGKLVEALAREAHLISSLDLIKAAITQITYVTQNDLLGD